MVRWDRKTGKISVNIGRERWLSPGDLVGV